MINLAIIQARMSSKRLPGKVLKKINGIPILEIVYYRLKKVKKIDKICIVTSRGKSDKKIVDFCKKNKIEFYTGNLNNVLSRFKFLVNKYLPRYIIRITAMDENYYDYFVIGESGEYSNALLNYPTTKGRSVGIQGGFGFFGSIASDRLLLKIAR